MKIREHIGEALDALTRLLRLDVRFYAKAANLFAWSQVSLVIRGLATTYLMALWLPMETFGAFKYVVALSGVAGIFAMGGMGNGVVRAVAQGDTVVAHRVFRSIAMFSPLGTLLLLILAIEPWMQHQYTLAYAIIAAAIAFVPQSTGAIYPLILTGKEQLKKLAIYNIVSNISIAVTFAIIIFFFRDLVIISITFFALDALTKFIPTIIELAKLPAKGEAREHLKLSRHMNGITIMQVIAFQIDKILIQRIVGFDALAVYSIATAIPDQLRALVGQFGNTFLQRLSRTGRETANIPAARRHYWIGLGIGTAITFAYIVSAPFIFTVLFPRYSDQWLPSIIYSLSLIPSISGLIGTNVAQVTRQYKLLWRIYTWNGLLQLITSIALIPFFGGWGAIIAKIVSRFGLFVTSYPRVETPSVTPSASHSRT